jgi:hypothetical protein
MSVKIFLSAVSNEFRAYREQLHADLTRHNVEVKVQEDFKDLGGDTFDKLDVYIAHCDAVVHLVGGMTGADPTDGERSALLTKHPDLADKLPPLGEVLKNGVALSYTRRRGLHFITANSCLSRKPLRPPSAARTTTPQTPRAPRRPRTWRVSRLSDASRAARSPAPPISPSISPTRLFSIYWRRSEPENRCASRAISPSPRSAPFLRAARHFSISCTRLSSRIKRSRRRPSLARRCMGWERSARRGSRSNMRCGTRRESDRERRLLAFAEEDGLELIHGPHGL